MDWNNDGKKDLIVGDSEGYIHVFLNTGTDDRPVLAAGRRLQVGGKDFKCPGTRAKPWVVDWNNDGRKDLLCGTENGTVLLLLNSGTDAAPVFRDAVPLKAGAADLNGGMRVCPVAWDWNRDGRKDLLCADEWGAVSFFENKGTDAAPVFERGIRLEARGWPISPGSRRQVRVDLNGDNRPEVIYCAGASAIQIIGLPGPAAPKADAKGKAAASRPAPLVLGGKDLRMSMKRPSLAAADWNNDGRTDLLAGQEDGRVLLFLNTGTPTKPAFAEPVALQDGGKPLNGGRQPIVDVVDWNGDGRKDLLCRDENDAVVWFENKGTDAAPVFAGPQKAEPPPSSPICGGYRARLDVADWNHDGRPDLIYGAVDAKDNKGYLYVFLAE